MASRTKSGAALSAASLAAALALLFSPGPAEAGRAGHRTHRSRIALHHKARQAPAATAGARQVVSRQATSRQGTARQGCSGPGCALRPSRAARAGKR
jgi:hypothetical protein